MNMVASPEVCRLNGAKSKGPKTERGKAIAARNATKHGLLATQPPILVSEDLETFQGLVQNLVDEYEPVGPVEWHWVQTIAMCIQRQHRLWGAEAALGNAQLLPPVEPPVTDTQYPTGKTAEENEHWSQYHPTNRAKERRLLQWYMDRHPQQEFPERSRSKYFADIWQEWIDSNLRDLKRLKDEYPKDGIPGKPSDVLAMVNQERYSDRFHGWLMDLWQQGHPYAEACFYARVLEVTNPPRSKNSWDYYLTRHAVVLERFQQRMDALDRIEQEIQQEQARYQRDLATYRAQTISPLSEQVMRLSRYESHIAKQLREAIAQLQTLQQARQTRGSMGSFGETMGVSD
jgi:hypothetical protein